MDLTVRRALLAAIRRHQDNPRRPRTTDLWIHSPASQFRDLDAGGMTANERGFTRSVYYQTWRVPINEGVPVEWSARLYWGKLEQRGGRLGRHVRLRLFRYRSGVRHVERTIARGDQWREDIEGGYTRSVPGARIDQNRISDEG